MTNDDLEKLPLISKKTRTEGSNIETIVSRIKSGRIIIPDYQRDAEQWDSRKESLFIESILNNLTVPGFFFSEIEDGKIEVVDGQQRLNTIFKYAYDEFEISENDEIDYLVPQSILYLGKKISQLPEKLKNVFNDYPLPIIYLPENIELSIKLEIFRRINEGGTPLTAQDIRLSYYSSTSVYSIRLAGVYADTSASKKKIETGKKKGIEFLWDKHLDSKDLWYSWWSGKAMAKGQTPSEMFLWYLILLHRNKLDKLLLNPNAIKHLPISFRGTTEEALDIFCAQLKYTDEKGGPEIFPTYGSGLENELEDFVELIRIILGFNLTGISVDKYKQMGLLIGAIIEIGIDLNTINNDAWDAISEFLRTPRKSGNRWLSGAGGYPEQKGRWRGSKGQKAQCDAVIKIIEKIIAAHK